MSTKREFREVIETELDDVGVALRQLSNRVLDISGGVHTANEHLDSIESSLQGIDISLQSIAHSLEQLAVDKVQAYNGYTWVNTTGDNFENSYKDKVGTQGEAENAFKDYFNKEV